MAVQPPLPDHIRPHVWARSMYQYPLFPNLPVNSIADFLFSAINIASTTPFRWDFIDAPAPGSLIFVWMAPQTFASPPTDGYQYLDPESVMHLAVGDKMVEVYEHKYGYNPRTEGMTGYVRRRFHLVQGGNPQLWLIHYLRSPDEDRLPINQAQAQQTYPPRPYPLPTLADVKFTISNTGQLVSFKNQATIWPPSMPPAQHYPPQQQPPFMNRPPPGQPLPSAYRPGQPMPMPGNKRIKVEDEEEEEVFIPKDVAAQRFVRWTEWMEEVLSSGYNIHDILPPPGPFDNTSPDALVARTQALDAEIQQSKQRHEEMLQKFKSTSKVWKDGTKKLAMTTNLSNPDPLATRVDGIAAAAKDAESAVSLEIKQPSHSNEIEEINKQVLAQCGIPNAKIQQVKKVRPVGKHINYEPAQRPSRPIQQKALPPPIQSPIKDETPDISQEEVIGEPEIDLESEAMEDGHANEAFEAMEAMEFDASAEFDFDENHDVNDLSMDMGVD